MQFAQAFDPFRSIGAAWKLLKQTPLTVLIGGILLSVLESGGSGFGYTGNWNLEQKGQSLDQVLEELGPILAILIPIAICVGLLMFVFSCWLLVGFARAIETGLRTGKDDIGKVFDGSGRFVQMLLARFLAALILLAACLPLVGVGIALWFVARHHDVEGNLIVLVAILAVLVWLPFYIYLALGFALLQPVVAYEDVGPTAGIARSWQLARGNRWRLLWFWIVLSIFSGLGICACCIGALITMPMAQVMRFEAYVALKSGDQYPQWWVGTGRFPFDEPVQSARRSDAPDPNAWASPQVPPGAPPAPPSSPPEAPPRV